MADTLKDKASATYDAARAKVEQGVSVGRVRASEAAQATKAQAGKAAAQAKAKAQRAAKQTVEGVGKNPMAALAGGIVVGAIVAALLPRTARENKLVGGVGNKVRSTAASAARTARDTAKGQLDTLGVNADAAKGQLRDLVSKISEAASTAGSAAVDTIRKK